VQVGVAAAAALAGMPIVQGRSLLAELARAHLVAEHAPGRYVLHDLLRAYATELSRGVDAEPDRRGALHRLLDYHLHSAYAADRLLEPNRDPIILAQPVAGVVPEDFADADQAIAWLNAEYPALVAAVDHAAVNGFDAHVWQLAWALAPFLDRRMHWRRWADTHHAALCATQRLADLAGQAYARRGLARAYARLGRHQDAHTHYQHALDLYRRVGDHAGEAHCHMNLTEVYEGQDRYQDALGHAMEALDRYRASGHRAGQASALNAVGWYHALVGDHRQALVHCGEALAMLREVGHRHAEADAWDSLGYAHYNLCNHQEAIACFRRALDLFRTFGNRHAEAITLTRLGDTHLAAGDATSARAAWHRAVDLLSDIDDADANEVVNRIRRLDRPDTTPTTPAKT
jgi:tetratricopeptide (TPR) repeat protein